MDENNLPKIDVKADLTGTIEKAYDNTLSKPLASSSGIVTTVMDFFHNTVLYPMQKYNLYAEDKLKNYANELESRAKAIPTENLISPRVNILGPVIDGLKYNLDEDYIKELFTNILIADMDNRKQSKVLPSYIELVKQLSKDDAKLLKYIKDNHLSQEAIIKLKICSADKSSFSYPSNDIFLVTSNDYQLIPCIIIDNLSRSKIIELDFFAFKTNETLYIKAFEKIKTETPLGIISCLDNLDYSKGLLRLTDFGKNFIDICLS